MKTTRIITLKPHDSGTAPLSLNGDRFTLKLGVKTDVPDKFLPLLDDSNINYEIVGAADEAGVGAKGDRGDAPAETSKEPPLGMTTMASLRGETADDQPETEQDTQTDARSKPDDKDEANVNVNDEAEPGVLDDNVPNIVAKLPGLSDSEVKALIADEKAGKSRSTLLAAMDERLNPPKE